MCIIIGDLHKFIDHCLIPLDPWTHTHTHNLIKTTNKKNRKILGRIRLHTQAFKNIKYQFLKYGTKGAIETILGHGKVKDR